MSKESSTESLDDAFFNFSCKKHTHKNTNTKTANKQRDKKHKDNNNMQQPRQNYEFTKAKLIIRSGWLSVKERRLSRVKVLLNFKFCIHMDSLSRRRRIFAPPRPLSRKCVGPVVGDPYHDSLFSWSVQMDTNLMGMCPFLWRASMETW